MTDANRLPNGAPVACSDDEDDDLMNRVVADQDEWIRVEFGDNAAAHANYGWFSDWPEPLTLHLETKVYGHGVLTTHARRQGGRDVHVTHTFQPFGTP